MLRVCVRRVIAIGRLSLYGVATVDHSWVTNYNVILPTYWPIIAGYRFVSLTNTYKSIEKVLRSNSYNGIVQVETLQHTAHICADSVTELIATVICRDIFGYSRIHHGELNRADRTIWDIMIS